MTSRYIHGIKKNEPHHVKVMLRLDEQLRRRQIRTYRGYEVRGMFHAQLNFHTGHIKVGPFGNLTWVHDDSFLARVR